jgi:hypothetical protein
MNYSDIEHTLMIFQLLPFSNFDFWNFDAATLWVISDAVNCDKNIFLVIFKAVNFDTLFLGVIFDAFIWG